MTTPPFLNLTGRVALVTGAGSPTGIGFARAKALGTLGAAVILTSTTDRVHERVEDLRSLGVAAQGVSTRLDTEEQVERLLSVLPEPITVLVNNAGMVAVGEELLAIGRAARRMR